MSGEQLQCREGWGQSAPGTVLDGPEGDAQDAATNQLEARVPIQAREDKWSGPGKERAPRDSRHQR